MDDLITKSTQRLKKIRNKYRELLHTSHNGGAGGVKDSVQYGILKNILDAIDEELKRRKSLEFIKNQEKRK